MVQVPALSYCNSKPVTRAVPLFQYSINTTWSTVALAPKSKVSHSPTSPRAAHWVEMLPSAARMAVVAPLPLDPATTAERARLAPRVGGAVVVGVVAGVGTGVVVAGVGTGVGAAGVGGS